MPNDCPLVSIVIPTYNQPRLLLETLQSVFLQTMNDYEIIVIDDGCTDNTLEALRPFEDRIRLISQPNGGIGIARNRGIAEARGKYVALLDHDDLWMPKKLAEQVHYYESHPECSVVSVRWASSLRPDKNMFSESVVDADGKIPRPLHILAQSQLILVSSAIMFNREKARGLQYATQRQCIEDTPFQIGLMGRGAFGVAGRDILMHYREHEQNYSSQASFFFNGLSMLREMDQSGAFVDYAGQARNDLHEFLASLGRFTAVKQLRCGERSLAWRVYANEFVQQVRFGRGRFLAMFPPLSLLPQRLIKKVWP